MDKTATQIYNSLQEMIDVKDFTTGNVLDIAFTLMQTIEKVRYLSGEEKKSVILHVLKQYNHDENGNEEGINFLIDNILGSVIDTIIALDKGILSIHTKCIQKGCFGCKKRSNSK